MAMKAIFITGTAGSGKSLLTSRLLQWYRDNSAYPVTLNLDPGAISLMSQMLMSAIMLTLPL
jgi:GTPase SAR1 family protein